MTTQVDLDIRYFRRYPKQATFLLPFKTGTYKAQIVDYSLIGLGIIVNDLEAPVSKGDIISFDIEEPDLFSTGKVAWTAKTTLGLRVGVLKDEPLKGRLTMYPFSDILLSLHRTRKTGVLQIRNSDLDKKVFIRDGDIISAASSHDKDHLGDVLLKRRKINKKQYERAAEIQRKSGSSYIAILLHMGYLSAADIITARKLQARKIISSLFLMKDSAFEFIEGILPQKDDIVVNLPIADVIYRETKKNADIWLLENYLLDKVVAFTPNPLNLFQQLRLPPADKSIVSNVNGKRSIRDIVQLYGANRTVNPLKIMYALLETRLLKITNSADSKPYVPFKVEKKESDPFVDHVEELYSKYKNIDYYNMLGLHRKASAEKIKNAFFNAEMKYDPDMHLLIDEDIKNKLDKIFAYIKNAHTVLTDPEKRRQYDFSLEESKVQENLIRDTQPCMSPDQENVHQKEEKAEQPSYWKILEDDSKKARLKFRDGQVAFWDKDYGKAARLFEMAAEIDCSVPEYPFMYGRALSSLGKNKEAAQAFNRANKLKPLDADILAELGHLYLNLRFPLRAASYFKQAIKVDPSNQRAREGLKKTG